MRGKYCEGQNGRIRKKWSVSIGFLKSKQGHILTKKTVGIWSNIDMCMEVMYKRKFKRGGGRGV
eukprot:UN02366